MNIRVKSSAFLYVSITLALILLFGTFFNHIAVFYINTFTGYRVQYDKFQDNLLLNSKIKGLTLSVKGDGLTAKVSEAVIDFLPGESLKERALVFKCDFNGVTFSVDKKLEGAASAGAILVMPFNSGWKYEKIAFLLDVGINSLKVSDFEALAAQVKMKGFYSGISKEMTFELELAFSPETTEEYLGEYKDFLFSPNKDGWYTAKITAKGNPDNPQISIQSDLFQMNIRAE